MQGNKGEVRASSVLRDGFLHQTPGHQQLLTAPLKMLCLTSILLHNKLRVPLQTLNLLCLLLLGKKQYVSNTKLHYDDKGCWVQKSRFLKLSLCVSDDTFKAKSRKQTWFGYHLVVSHDCFVLN